ncbi:MAG: CHAT domain-containing protein [Erythrobacter sp.]|nr:MAG: CHAT domain-containing protein [Erythrobacter sp.]
MTRLSAKSVLLGAACSLAITALMPGVAAANAPEVFTVGENSEGDTCSAALQWTNGEGAVLLARDQPFGITCRGIDAADLQGYVSGSAVPEVGNCGEAIEVALTGIGMAQVRRCADAQLGRSAVDIRFERNGQTWHGAAIPTALPNLEAALRVIAAGGAIPRSGATVEPSIALDAIPAGPDVIAGSATGGITSESAFTEGVRALQTGRQIDASRILNDALREFASADLSTLVDLRLAAGLADSNVSQFEAAEQHFAAAEALLDGQGTDADSQQVQQLLVYRGLHLINQRQWTRAIAALSRSTPESGQLLDPTLLSRLNQETLAFGGTGASGAGAGELQSSLADSAALQSVLLEAQRYWTLSVAYLASGDAGLENAEAAIANAGKVATGPIGRIEPARIGWLHSAIERQQGRIHARRNDTGAAIASFDCAIAALRGTVPGNPGACVVTPLSRQADTSATSALLLETQLERASIASRDPARRDSALADYRAVVGGIANLDGVGPVSQAALERYFDLLASATPNAARNEEFFSAMQSIGEPAIAREYAVMQQRLSADEGVRELLRERRDLQQARNGLSFEIGGLSGTDAETASLRTEKQAELDAVVAQLDAVNVLIDQTGGIAQLSDNPIMLQELAASLEPGEVYLKLVQLNDSMYGMAISPGTSELYRIEGTLAEVEAEVESVLASAQTNAEARLMPYDVAGANALFRRIAGPATQMVAGASRVIFDPAGAFRRMPIAILVTDDASVDTYLASGRLGDYSSVGFLGKQAETAVSLSPRAFLGGRTNPTPSAAQNEFIGFADAPPPVLTQQQSQAMMPFDCSLTLGRWAEALYSADPVSALELQRIASALGMASVPQFTGQSFTDVSLTQGAASGSLDQYKILHFATHGLSGRRVEVAQDNGSCMVYVPPSLVTALAAPDAAGTVLSDGLLAFDEVTSLQLDANLVVLSACDTSGSATTLAGRAAGFETSDAALDGLVRSFLVAEARAVMATFWRVPDNVVTLDLMSTFYAAGRTDSIAGALRTAQLSVLENPRRSHPYYWGNFFLVGNGTNSMFAGPTQVAMN